MTESTGNLVHNLILFGRLLRGLGLDVHPGRMIDLIQALQFISIEDKADFYFSTRSLLVQRQEDIPLFDRAFEAFWREPAAGRTSQELKARSGQRSNRGSRLTPPLRAPDDNSLGRNGKQSGASQEPPIVEATFTYSDREVLRRKDFAALSGEELQAIQALISELAWQLGMRRTRRLEAGPGANLDLRRILRGNLKYGGEVLFLASRRPKLKPRPLVMIADISGSMERYSRLLLHFIFSLSQGLQQKVESFVFSTRLTRITHQLRKRDVDQALDDVARLVPDWSGGTRIGQALKSFNFDWARRVLGQGAIVLLISDGWDRGDAELLQDEISRLQRSCYRLIWLNPLLGSDQYEPLTKGMQTALPFVDDFLPVHNLASLEDLARRLELVGVARSLHRSDKSRPGKIMR